jgi:hypothetical protein
VTADKEDTSHLQWKILSDIYNFLDDKVIRLAQTVDEYKWLMAKFGTSEYAVAFQDNYSKIEETVTEMRTGSKSCKQLALRHQIIQHTLYKKYESYLQELLSLNPEKLFDDYFLKGKIPLETFDETCVDKEGDPIKYLQKEINEETNQKTK